MCPSAAPPQLIRTRGTEQVTTLHLKEVARLYVLTLYVCRLRYEDLKMKLNMNIRYLHITPLYFS